MKKLLLALLLIPVLALASVQDPIVIQSPYGWTSCDNPNPLYYEDGGMIRFKMPGQYNGVDTVLVEQAGPFTVTFGDVWAKVMDYDDSNTAFPGWGNFANEPSRGVVATPYYGGGAGDGNIYITGDEAHYVSLWFANYVPPFTFKIWGQGEHAAIILAEVSSDTLGVAGTDTNYDCECCSGDPTGVYCKWKKLVLTSSSPIIYFTVEGPEGPLFVLDDILIGTTTSAPTPCSPSNQPCEFE